MAQLKTSSGQIVEATQGDGMYEQYVKGGASLVQPAASAPAQTAAPTTPAPAAPVTPISTSDITSPKTNISVNIQKQQKDLAGVQAALQDTSLYSKIASDGFINAAFNAAYGRNANADELAKVGTNQYGMGGLSVQDVVKKLKLDRYLKDYGMGAQDAGTQTSGTTGSVQTKSSGIQDMGKTGDPTRDTLADFFNEDIDEYEAAKNRLTGERQAVTDKSQVVNGIKAEIDTMKNELDYNQVLQTAAVANIKSDYYAQKDKIESRPVPMSDINKALNKLGNETNISLDKESIAAAVTNATNTYRYNSKLIEYNVALGDLQTAQQIAKDTAADIKEYKSEMLGIMSQVYQMDQNTRQLKQQEVDREYEMAMQGYTYVPNPTALQELAKKKGTDWVEANTTKIGGKIWIMPEQVFETEKPITQQVGNTLLQYNTKTGSWEPVYAGAENGGAPGITKVNGEDYVWNGTEFVKPNLPASVDQEKVQSASNALSQVLKIESHEGLNAAVGAKGFSSMFGAFDTPISGTKAADFVAQFNTLKSLLTMENMDKMKGVLSDSDMKVLREAATSLSLDMSEKSFKGELSRVKETLQKAAGGSEGIKDRNYYKSKYPQATDQEIDALIKQHGSQSFNSVGGGTNSATINKVVSTQNGAYGGQCGSFVNKYTGLGLGDSYKSKMSKMDPTIKKPEPGMVFVMPYKSTGHTGFIVGIDGDKAIVKHSNYGLNERVSMEKIPLSKMTGFVRV